MPEISGSRTTLRVPCRAAGVLIAVFSLARFASGGANAWTQTSGPEGGPVSALAVDAKAANVIYAGTAAGSIFRSDDAAEHWNLLNSAAVPDGIENLAVSDTASTLFAVSNTGYLYASFDRG
jgi:photosystem II stability/assembly factor-like uncharacterized protein